MDKRKALAVIVESLSIFPKHARDAFLARIPSLSDEDVAKYGVFFAGLKKLSTQEAKEVLEKVSDVNLS